MITRKFALAAAFIFAGTAAFSAISDETQGVIKDFLANEQFERAEVRVGLSQIKIEMISNGQKVEVILDKDDGTELKRETEEAGPFDNKAPGIFTRERNRDFLRIGSDDDSNDDDDDLDDSDDDSSDDSDDDSNDDNDDDSNDDDSNDDDSNDDNGNDDSSDE